MKLQYLGSIPRSPGQGFQSEFLLSRRESAHDIASPSMDEDVLVVLYLIWAAPIATPVHGMRDVGAVRIIL